MENAMFIFTTSGKGDIHFEIEIHFC